MGRLSLPILAVWVLRVLLFPYGVLAQGPTPGIPSIPSQRIRPVSAPSLADHARFQKGISYTGWWAGEYQKPVADLSLQRLATTGANWISLVVTAHQQDPSATVIDRSHPSTPTDDDLAHVIRRAHELGLQVMLKPHVDLVNERETGLWRGHIGTEFSSEAQWATWFDAYREFILHYAILAQEQGADQFCVGTELLGTSHREADWRRVVAEVRAVYHGPLVYAALHGGEEVSLAWWDAVDYIGVDAYYRLDACDVVSHHPSVDELVNAWEQPKAVLADLSARYERPILLTEIGYRSYHGGTYQPWDSWMQGPLDPDEQANAYEAAFRALFHEPWLGGIYWWQWRADLFVSGTHDSGYTPVLKPAEEVLRAWYGGAPASDASTDWPDYSRTLDIYRDGLGDGWEDWSWGAERRWSAHDHVHAGTSSIGVTLEPWGALSLWHPAFDAGEYRWLEFDVLGAHEGIRLQVHWEAVDGTALCDVPVNDPRHIKEGVISAKEWRTVRLPMAYLNAPGMSLTRLTIQNASGEGSAALWIDEVRLVAAAGAPSQSVVYLPLSLRPR